MAVEMKLSKKNQQIRKELRTQGWSLVDTTRYLTDDELVKMSVDKKTSKDCFVNGKIFICSGHKTLGYYDFRWCEDKFVSNETFSKVLIDYKKFIQSTIDKCLYDEPMIFNGMEFRHHTKKSERGDWHLDGMAIRVIGAVKGQTTEFRPSFRSRKVLQIPVGWTLIFTGKFRGKKNVESTIHRMPEYSGVRKLIVSSFLRTKKK